MSIDSSGGYFKQKYGLDPHIISTLMSVWLMVVSFVMTAVFVGLLFFINLKNPIHSLKLGGKTFIIFGAAHFFIAALMFIVGAAKNTFFISGVLKAIALGARNLRARRSHYRNRLCAFEGCSGKERRRERLIQRRLL